MGDVLQIYFDNKKDADEAAKAILKSTKTNPASYMLSVWGKDVKVGKLDTEQDPDDSNYQYIWGSNRTLATNTGEKTLINNEWV